MWSIAEAKVSKELKPFDGSHSKYEIWANRIKDHFKKKYSDWEYLFDEVEAQEVPMSKDRQVSSYSGVSIKGSPQRITRPWSFQNCG